MTAALPVEDVVAAVAVFEELAVAALPEVPVPEPLEPVALPLLELPELEEPVSALLWN